MTPRLLSLLTLSAAELLPQLEAGATRRRRCCALRHAGLEFPGVPRALDRMTHRRAVDVPGRAARQTTEVIPRKPMRRPTGKRLTSAHAGKQERFQAVRFGGLLGPARSGHGASSSSIAMGRTAFPGGKKMGATNQTAAVLRKPSMTTCCTDSSEPSCVTDPSW